MIIVSCILFHLLKTLLEKCVGFMFCDAMNSSKYRLTHNLVMFLIFSVFTFVTTGWVIVFFFLFYDPHLYFGKAVSSFNNSNISD